MQIRKAERRIVLDRARSINPQIYDRLIANSENSNPSDCWEWSLVKDKDGYGILKVNGKRKRAHRLMHNLFYPHETAPIVRHICNNRACINPIHLCAGTQKDNACDRVAFLRGGNLKGSANGRAKLTEVQAREILASKKTGAELAKIYSISKAMACRIKRGNAWQHILGEE